jgi:hypothetical protein
MKIILFILLSFTSIASHSATIRIPIDKSAPSPFVIKVSWRCGDFHNGHGCGSKTVVKILEGDEVVHLYPSPGTILEGWLGLNLIGNSKYVYHPYYLFERIYYPEGHSLKLKQPIDLRDIINNRAKIPMIPKDNLIGSNESYFVCDVLYHLQKLQRYYFHSLKNGVSFKDEKFFRRLRDYLVTLVEEIDETQGPGTIKPTKENTPLRLKIFNNRCNFPEHDISFGVDMAKNIVRERFAPYIDGEDK